MLEALAPALISGFLTVWFRPCDLITPCGLPQTVAPSTAISGEIKAPPAPGRMTDFRTKFESSLVKGQFNLLWAYPKEGNPYFITRVEFFDIDSSKPLAQCNIYGNEQTSLPFPVGSCAAFVEQEGVTYEVGVTFSRTPQGQ